MTSSVVVMPSPSRSLGSAPRFASNRASAVSRVATCARAARSAMAVRAYIAPAIVMAMTTLATPITTVISARVNPPCFEYLRMHFPLSLPARAVSAPA